MRGQQQVPGGWNEGITATNTPPGALLPVEYVAARRPLAELDTASTPSQESISALGERDHVLDAVEARAEQTNNIHSYFIIPKGGNNGKKDVDVARMMQKLRMELFPLHKFYEHDEANYGSAFCKKTFECLCMKMDPTQWDKEGPLGLRRMARKAIGTRRSCDSGRIKDKFIGKCMCSLFTVGE